eukprot:gene11887-12970_t
MKKISISSSFAGRRTVLSPSVTVPPALSSSIKPSFHRFSTKSQTNLIINPGCETGSLSGWSSSNNYNNGWYLSTLYPYTGTYYFFSQCSSSCTPLTQTVTLSVGSNYIISFWAFASGTRSFQVTIGSITLYSSFALPTSYTYYATTFTANAASMTLTFTSTGSTRLDDVSLIMNSAAPSYTPTRSPTTTPTYLPTYLPTVTPSVTPTAQPTYSPTRIPTAAPSFTPTTAPTYTPSAVPTGVPTMIPTYTPSATPTRIPTAVPSYSAMFALGGYSLQSTASSLNSVQYKSVSSAFVIEGGRNDYRSINLSSTAAPLTYPRLGSMLKQANVSHVVASVGDMNRDGLQDVILANPLLSLCQIEH